MIGRLNGTLLEKNPPRILLDCHGVGYEVDVPMSTFYTLPSIGQPLVLLTYLIVREDAHLLFGFASAQERDVFKELLKVNGIGARIALAILSGLSVQELLDAIAKQSISRLTTIPGIGKKTAERLILELKGKLGSLPGADAFETSTEDSQDILQALLALGYSEKEVLPITRKLAKDISVADGIKQALKELAY